LAVRVRQYPKAAWVVLGRPGLERFGHWTPWVQTFMESHLDESWMPDYVNWHAGLGASET
jgi:hypothetical protein